MTGVSIAPGLWITLAFVLTSVPLQLYLVKRRLGRVGLTLNDIPGGIGAAIAHQGVRQFAIGVTLGAYLVLDPYWAETSSMGTSARLVVFVLVAIAWVGALMWAAQAASPSIRAVTEFTSPARLMRLEQEQRAGARRDGGERDGA